ncbi:hypothetical protein AALA69_03565 [Eggerthellaceae bacterium 24-137]
MSSSKRRVAVAVVALLVFALGVPSAAFAATYPGAQKNLYLTSHNESVRAYQSNNYIEPAIKRLTAGIVVKCSSDSMRAKEAKMKAVMMNSSSEVISSSKVIYSQAVSREQFAYCTTVLSTSSGVKIRGRASGTVWVKDARGSYVKLKPVDSPMKSSL